MRKNALRHKGQLELDDGEHLQLQRRAQQDNEEQFQLYEGELL